ncbi:transcription termination/antitermination protein NusG [Litoreibacter albidus]|uniref:Transcription termination/antitermination protein NusG n=1 Tax=Litoreibacter albidus TaxID=670155 RepID=A0A1H3DMG1_9RHOB|nr:transcriptional activator RfaH [Litoreibacter albidus]SDX67693.1 transcriptional antiterminator RfaH [Litoreibacter albidus]
MTQNVIAEDMGWFLAQLKPNSAQIAKRNLERQGFETFLPLEETTQQRSGRFVTARRPLFPGYIFVAFNAVQGCWRSINSTQGIKQLVSFGRAPTPVPCDLVDGLKARCDRLSNLVEGHALGAGDAVTFTNGPFSNFVGEIEKVESQQRVWVLMDLMGGRTRVAANEAQLRAV